MSLQGEGQIVQGIDHINQCINIVVLTRLGSDPLRPEFGCAACDKIDQPLSQSGTAIIKDVKDAINNFIPEIVVNKVEPAAAVAALTINITWSFKSDAQIQQFQTTSVTYGKQ